MPRSKKTVPRSAGAPRPDPLADFALPIPFEVRTSATIKQRWGDVSEAARGGLAQVTTRHGHPDLVLIAARNLLPLLQGSPLDVRDGLLDRYLTLFDQARSRLHVLSGGPSLSEAFRGAAQDLRLSFRAGAGEPSE